MGNDLNWHKEDLEKIKSLRFIDDDFMTISFDNFIEGAELVIKTILNRKDLRVTSVETQIIMLSLNNRSIKLDILAVDEDNKLYNIEIQRSDKGADVKRARFHSSIIDTKYLDKSEDFNKLPENYVIFITENDVMDENEPIYFIDRVVINSKGQKLKLFNDGEHIIYVNGSYQDETTDIGKLMHDFFCENPDDMNYEVLADKARYYKENEEGVNTMCKVFEDIRNEAKKEYAKETARGMLADNKLSIEEIAKYSRLTVDEVLALKGTASA